MDRKRLARPFTIKGSVSEAGTFAGYGSVFGVEDYYSDIVMPGAFTRSLKERGLPKMLWQHNADRPCGVWTKAAEDDKGLYLEGQLALDATDGKDAYALLKIGALDGLSIGFSTKIAKYDDKAGIRQLLDVDLWEVSPVTFPANEAATIDTVKAMTHGDVAAVASQVGKLHGLCGGCESSDCQGEMMTGLDALCASLGGGGDGKSTATRHELKRSIESFLRDAGKTRSEAKAGAAAAFVALGLRDADDEAAEVASAIRNLTQAMRN